MKESDTMRLGQRVASELGARVFRNNVGTAWQGKGKPIFVKRPLTIQLQKGDVVLRQGRPVRFGLMEGSSDLIGWRPIKITLAMVGRKIAQFVSLEAKHRIEDTPTPQQRVWLEVVETSGGVSAVFRNPQKDIPAAFKRDDDRQP